MQYQQLRIYEASATKTRHKKVKILKYSQVHIVFEIKEFVLLCVEKEKRR